MTLANWITISRLTAIPILLYGIGQPAIEWRWISFIIFLMAALTDWLDGYIARKFDQITDLGKFLDPLVDKLLIMAPLLVLVQLQMVPAWGVFLILAREIAIAGWRVNQSQISGANIWGKLKTVSQIIAIGLLIFPLGVDHYDIIPLTAFWISVLLTIISGLIYVTNQSSHQTEKLE